MSQWTLTWKWFGDALERSKKSWKTFLPNFCLWLVEDCTQETEGNSAVSNLSDHGIGHKVTLLLSKKLFKSNIKFIHWQTSFPFYSIENLFRVQWMDFTLYFLLLFVFWENLGSLSKTEMKLSVYIRLIISDATLLIHVWKSGLILFEQHEEAWDWMFFLISFYFWKTSFFQLGSPARHEKWSCWSMKNLSLQNSQR